MWTVVIPFGWIPALSGGSAEHDRLRRRACNGRHAIDGQGLWDKADGMYYDRLLTPSGHAVPLKVRSVVGIIPALAVAMIDADALRRVMTLNKQFMASWRARASVNSASWPRPRRCAEMRVVSGSACHRDHPYEFGVDGYRSVIGYEPAESTTPMFGGNSNWRGPVWLPLNYLIVGSLERYDRFRAAADPRRDRRRPAGPADLPGHPRCRWAAAVLRRHRPDADRPACKDNRIFSEYFHGDNGAAIGAFH